MASELQELVGKGEIVQHKPELATLLYEDHDGELTMRRFEANLLMTWFQD